MLRFLQFAALGFAVFTAVASGDRVITTESPASGVAFSKDGNSLGVFEEDNKIGVWDLASGKWIRYLELPKGESPPLLLSSGRHFATDTTNGVIKIRELASGVEIAAVDDPPPNVFGKVTVLLTDGVLFAAAGKDPVSPSSTLIRVVDRAGKLRFQVPAGIGGAQAMAFSPGEDTFVAAGLDTDIRVWDARTGELQRVISELNLAMFTMAYSPDGKYLATAGADRTIYLWDAKSWKLARKITGQPETIAAICFSPDGTLLVTGGMNELNFASPVKVVLWDFASGRQLRTWTAEHVVEALAFSPGGEQVAVADGTKSVKLFAVPNKAGASKH
jgi:WD40 repeat protein